jgi:hypothetical protein
MRSGLIVTLWFRSENIFHQENCNNCSIYGALMVRDAKTLLTTSGMVRDAKTLPTMSDKVIKRAYVLFTMSDNMIEDK